MTDLGPSSMNRPARYVLPCVVLAVALTACATNPIGRLAMPTSLPKSMQSHTIDQMRPGDTGYTVPWAMVADEKHELWLNANYTLEPYPGGTVQMLVRRDSRGFRVDVSNCQDYKWTPRNNDDKWASLPVTSVDGAP